jgi:hypothetical protein
VEEFVCVELPSAARGLVSGAKYQGAGAGEYARTKFFAASLADYTIFGCQYVVILQTQGVSFFPDGWMKIKGETTYLWKV